MVSTKEIVVTPAVISQIRDILSQFLQECDIIYPHDVRVDPAYRVACYSEAKRRGFDLAALGRSLEVAVAISDTSYRHLKNQSTRVFIAMWTTLVTYIDDSYQLLAEGLDDFFDRFLRQEPQQLDVLDQFACVIRELPQHWGIISANLMTTSGMDFLTSMIIDSSIQGMKICSSMAPNFPTFTRRMTGISRAYCVMVFPPELDIKTWIQVVPDLMHYIDHANDLLSFFKEELQGETVNFVSMCAVSDNVTKIEALRKLADETVQGYKRASRLLRSVPEAWEAYQAFCVGYVRFHALSVRYKLDQLHL